MQKELNPNLFAAAKILTDNFQTPASLLQFLNDSLLAIKEYDSFMQTADNESAYHTFSLFLHYTVPAWYSVTDGNLQPVAEGLQYIYKLEEGMGFSMQLRDLILAIIRYGNKNDAFSERELAKTSIAIDTMFQVARCFHLMDLKVG